MNRSSCEKAALTKKRQMYADYEKALASLIRAKASNPKKTISCRSVAKEAGRNHVSLSKNLFYKKIKDRILELAPVKSASILTPAQKVISARKSVRAFEEERNIMATKYQDVVLQLREKERLVERLQKEIGRGSFEGTEG